MSGYTQHLLRIGKGVVRWQRFKRFRKAAEAIQKFAPGGQANLLLDIGAADGIGLPFWSTCARRILSMNYYHNHSCEFGQNHPEQPILTANAMQMPLADACVDTAVSLETLHLLPGPESRRQCLAEINRVLRPGGLLVCTVAIEVGLPAVVKYAGRAYGNSRLDGMDFRMVMRHVFYRMPGFESVDRGEQIGFDAYRFARDVAGQFEIVRRSRIPLPWPLCTNLLLVCRKRV